jgi:hypothetical protein
LNYHIQKTGVDHYKQWGIRSKLEVSDQMIASLIL